MKPSRETVQCSKCKQHVHRKSVIVIKNEVVCSFCSRRIQTPRKKG